MLKRFSFEELTFSLNNIVTCHMLWTISSMYKREEVTQIDTAQLRNNLIGQYFSIIHISN